ncbi:Dynactin subunit 1 [Trichoplax sp. H2]|nr:Dynactin subunit 1 [Trichoplax sp. H2]|eukprot:RDD38595.1 Dynactin subunit 1 [Trichoplax sp. H2]
MSEKSIKLGQKVEVPGRGYIGTVAYIGSTSFAPGKWVGIILDEPKGKNNGTVQGKRYFTCEDNFGMFVRPTQINILEEVPSTDVTSSSEKLSVPVESKRRNTGPSSPTSPRTPAVSVSASTSTEKLNVPTESKRRNTGPSKDKSTVPTGVKTGKSGPQISVIVAKDASTNISKPLPSPKNATKNSSIVNPVSKQPSITSDGHSVKLETSTSNDNAEELLILKRKREEDALKMKDYEKLKLQLQQEAQSDLQKKLKEAKKEAKEAIEFKEKFETEMQEKEELLQLAMLDKELANEKVLVLQDECEQSLENIEELKSEIELLKGEVEDLKATGSNNDSETTHQVQLLQKQQRQLKDALIKMRELSMSERQDHAQTAEELKKKSSQLKSINADVAKLRTELANAEETIEILKEQVDAAVGAQDMLEKLTDNNLELDERNRELNEQIDELEALVDMNDELEENHQELERDLRDEIASLTNELLERNQRLEIAINTTADQSSTINKFRDLVQQLQEENVSYREKLESNIVSESPKINTQAIDYKLKMATTKAHGKAIDIELLKVEISMLNYYNDLLLTFLPKSFVDNGGERDCLLVMTLMNRVSRKSSIISTQVKERFAIGDALDLTNVDTSQLERVEFGCRIIQEFSNLIIIVNRIESAMSVCSMEIFSKLGSLYADTLPHEKAIDNIIELLRKDQLDENCSLDSLQKCLAFFKHLVNTHLTNEPIDHCLFLCDHANCLGCLADYLSVNLSGLLIIGKHVDNSHVKQWLTDLSRIIMNIRQHCRKVKRNIPQDGNSIIELPKKIYDTLSEHNDCLRTLGFLFQDVCSNINVQAISPGEDVNISEYELENTILKLIHKSYGSESSLESLRDLLEKIEFDMQTIADALQSGEYDNEGNKGYKGEAPYSIRAKEMIGIIDSAVAVEKKLKEKEETVTELRKGLKGKNDEIGELKVRINMLEKRVENATKESQAHLQDLERKLEHTKEELAKKESVFEAAMDGLQQDIEDLEREKEELEKRLNTVAKKSMMTNISQRGPPSGIAAIVAGLSGSSGTDLNTDSNTITPGSIIAGETSQVVIRDSDSILKQVDILKSTVRYLRNENLRLKGEKAKIELASLPPIILPNSLSKPYDELEAEKEADGNTETIDDEQEKETKIDVNKENSTDTTFQIASSRAPMQIKSRSTTKTTEYSVQSVVREICDVLHRIESASSNPIVVDISNRKPGNVPASEKQKPSHQLVNRVASLNELQSSYDQLQKKVSTFVANRLPGGVSKTTFSSFVTPVFSKSFYEQAATPVIGKVTIPTLENEYKMDRHNLLLQHSQWHALHTLFVR